MQKSKYVDCTIPDMDDVRAMRSKEFEGLTVWEIVGALAGARDWSSPVYVEVVDDDSAGPLRVDNARWSELRRQWEVEALPAAESQNLAASDCVKRLLSGGGPDCSATVHVRAGDRWLRVYGVGASRYTRGVLVLAVANYREGYSREYVHPAQGWEVSK